ncbi:MAG: GGDEF domain-containing protein [Candidatus Competibacteraceae bacterium]|nr:GGDEF domain-containing protein [Candidatus Competibacteraceae bacterium]
MQPTFRYALSKFFWVMIGFGLIPVIFFFDTFTGYEVICTLFYLIPIAIVTWFGGRLLGIVVAIVNALAWAFADSSSGHTYSHTAIFYWNSTVVFGIFLVLTLLLSVLKDALEKQTALAFTDYLTGALNRRAFSDLLQMEIDRSKRYKHPFTVAYIDIDNFKQLNDKFGHRAGDLVLCTVADLARTQLRSTDLCARLGGDEFALFFPESGQEAAQIITSKIQLCLLGEMEKNKWPVTFSIGVLTFIDNIPHTVDEVIDLSDSLMYAVKNNGKDAISYSIYTG